MFDCAYQPEWQPEPTAMPERSAPSHVWLAASLVLLVQLAGSGDSVPGRACGPDSVMAGEGPPSTTFPGGMR